jgi:broad specificity phosphatase PhoE
MAPGAGRTTTTTTTIYLARHGETPWNSEGRWQGRTDIALSETGRAQAAALAIRLARLGDPIGRVLSSDLCRAAETATIVCRALGLPAPTMDARLRERSFGVFEGLTRDECIGRYPAEWARYEQDRRLHPPGGEPQEEVAARFEAAVSEALAAQSESNGALLIVAHGGALRSFLSVRFGRPFPAIANVGVLRLRVRVGAEEEIEDLGGG